MTLTRICIDLESISDGLSENWNEISRKARKFQGFFRPKLGGLQKKKKSSPKLRVIFRPKTVIQRFFPPKHTWSPKIKKKGLHRNWDWFFVQFRKFRRLRGAVFLWGGYFQFFTINWPQKHKKHAILHTSQANGGARAPPGYATAWEYSAIRGLVQGLTVSCVKIQEGHAPPCRCLWRLVKMN